MAGGAWRRALQLAERTPPGRNRYVDFLRALSIMAVVTGHWLIAAPHVTADGARLGHMLDIASWTQWLTWVFQVMPVFFIVGGYSNSASWTAARREGTGYGPWLAARLDRLIGPLLPLLIVWAGLGLTARMSGVQPDTIRLGSQAALVPVWFLAVYVVVIMLAPPAHALWRRFGLGSVLLLAGAAVAIDGLRFGGGMVRTAWINYAFVWLTVHQLGFAWRDGWFRGARAPVAAMIGGLSLVAMVTWGPYPLSMVGVPGDEVSNTLPPSLAMLALGLLQGGLLLSFETPGRRLLEKTRTWAAVVLVNGTIMSVYLWHLTTMILVIAVMVGLGGTGLRLDPGSDAWWSWRPAWMALLAVALVPFLAVFARFERPKPRTGATPPAWRLVVGATLCCAGLALLALEGVGTGPVLLPFAGAILTGTLRR